MHWPTDFIASCRHSAADVLDDEDLPLEVKHGCTRDGADAADREICVLYGLTICPHYERYRGHEALNLKPKKH